MRTFFLLLFLLISSAAFSQHEFMVWTEVGAKGKIVKKLSWSAELNGRFGDGAMQTFFPQVGLEYKVKKWLKPSIEYRFILDKNKYGNYKTSSRINLNIGLAKDVKRFNLGLRFRYQQALSRSTSTSYDADFDQAFRFKPSVSYDINNSIFTPVISGEFFLNPIYGPNSPGFTKMRLAIGAKLELDSPHGISFKYQLDKKFHNFEADLRHVISLSYAYKF